MAKKENALDICMNCLNEFHPDDLNFGVCEDCWDDVSEEWCLGYTPFERKRVFDDEQDDMR